MLCAYFSFGSWRYWGWFGAFAPEEFLTLHPWEGRCRALSALWVYFLIWKDLKQSAALSGAAGLPE